MSEAVPKSEMVRLFIALPVPAAVMAELKRAQAQLREQFPGDVVRWTRPEQIHLTLKFLGGVASSQVDALSQAVHAACHNFPPLHLHAERIGFFPQIRHPRVIWVSVRDDQEQLGTLQKAIAEAAAPFTLEQDEKEFTAHLTLGRAKNIKSHEARDLAEASQGMAKRVFGDWTADKVDIMRSELHSAGSRYSCLASMPLSGS
jgi:RNA 2',3'-cyclic 3'-phosphodiesterase